MRLPASCVVLATLLLAAAPVHGAEGVVAWSTYLRGGPGQAFAAISEVEHDRRVQVLACDGGWCRIRDEDGTVGFIDHDALALSRTAAPLKPASADCVTAALTDNRKPMPTRFCTGAAPPR